MVADHTIVQCSKDGVLVALRSHFDADHFAHYTLHGFDGASGEPPWSYDLKYSTMPPKLSEVRVLGPDQVLVIFDEPVDAASAGDAANYASRWCGARPACPTTSSACCSPSRQAGRGSALSPCPTCETSAATR